MNRLKTHLKKPVLPTQTAGNISVGELLGDLLPKIARVEERTLDDFPKHAFPNSVPLLNFRAETVSAISPDLVADRIRSAYEARGFVGKGKDNVPRVEVRTVNDRVRHIVIVSDEKVPKAYRTPEHEFIKALLVVVSGEGSFSVMPLPCSPSI